MALRTHIVTVYLRFGSYFPKYSTYLTSHISYIIELKKGSWNCSCIEISMIYGVNEEYKSISVNGSECIPVSLLG